VNPIESEVRAFLERLDRQLQDSRSRLASAKEASDEIGREFWRDVAGVLTNVFDDAAALRALVSEH
jgi:hypothetical protein